MLRNKGKIEPKHNDLEFDIPNFKSHNRLVKVKCSDEERESFLIIDRVRNYNQIINQMDKGCQCEEVDLKCFVDSERCFLKKKET